MQPLVDADDIWAVDERVRSDGSVETAIDLAEVDRMASRAQEENIKTVAVCLLHAYLNPIHEVLIKERFAQIAPSIAVVLSHVVSPELGEFERAATTVATGYIARAVETYLTTLTEELACRGDALHPFMLCARVAVSATPDWSHKT